VFLHKVQLCACSYVCTECSDYAKQVAVLIERIGLVVHISVLAADADVMDKVEEAMNRGRLFALSVTGQQSSTSLYILHGEPEGELCVC